MRSTVEWWQGLSVQDKCSLRRRLRDRDEVVVARFVEADSDDWPSPSDFYEYLVGHEVYLEDGRGLHICSAHPEARAALDRGLIPRDFLCPRGEVTCPMRQLLSEGAGRDCLLRLDARPKGAGR
jgi:hypothetical protein